MQLISLLLLSLLFFSPTSQATSFTSFRVTDQIEEAHYVIRGRVGKMSVREEPTTARPYTYWEFSVIEAYSDDKLRGRIDIRQPGGEIDGIGYYVSATAKFQEGEDVVVMLRDTQEDAKEVVGLASGKYTVMKDDDGNEYLQNGLGFPLKDASGNLIGPNQFGKLVDRVLSRDTTESDLNIRVNPRAHAGHLHQPDSGFPKFVQKEPSPAPAKPTPEPTVIVNNSDLSSKKPIEAKGEITDRNPASEADINWIRVISIMVGFLLIVWVSFLILKPRE